MAWHPLGWTPAFFSEIDAFPRAVLAHHYPTVPLHGDFTTIKSGDYAAIDLLVGGTPCQSFSVAGLRGGLDDERGNLALEYLRLAQRLRPRWLVWENVPGVLSSAGGRDFGSILGGMVELGYGFAYRVLDAQHFGVPQRRRRVFVVGYSGDWRPAAAVLFERHSLQGHSPPRRETGKAAPTIPSRRSGGGGLGTDFDCDGGLIAQAFGGNNQSGPIDVATAVNAHGGPHGRLDFESETFVAHAFDARQSDVIQYGDRTGPLDTDGHSIAIAFDTYNQAVSGDVTQTLCSRGDSPGGNAHLVPAIAFALRGREDGALPEVHGEGDSTGALRAASGGSSRDYIAFDTTQITSPLNRSVPKPGDPCHPLAAAAHAPAIAQPSAVRRLTPVECERLQGFPDGYTAIPYRGKPAADGPRYKALGNSMAVPVMRWVGERIAQVENLTAIAEAAE